MTYLANRDYNLEVLRGNVPGHSMISMRGHDETVPMGGPFGLSPQFGGNGYLIEQGEISSTPAAVAVASTDNTNDKAGGTGALTVRIDGLDASGNAQSAVETMNGQTEVTTTELWTHVGSVTVLTTGSANRNAGTIYVGTGTFTSGVPARRMLSMEIFSNISLTGYYVVPTGKIAYPRQFVATVGSTNKNVEVVINTSPNGHQWYEQGPFGIGSGVLITDIIALPGFAAGTHVKLTAEGGAASTVVTAIVAFEVVDN